MKTSIRYAKDDVFAQARNGRKFGLPTRKLLELAVANRKAGENERLRTVQQKLARIRFR